MGKKQGPVRVLRLRADHRAGHAEDVHRALHGIEGPQPEPIDHDVSWLHAMRPQPGLGRRHLVPAARPVPHTGDQDGLDLVGAIERQAGQQSIAQPIRDGKVAAAGAGHDGEVTRRHLGERVVGPPVKTLTVDPPVRDQQERHAGQHRRGPGEGQVGKQARGPATHPPKHFG